MANMIMASSKTLTKSSSPLKTTPTKPRFHLPQISLPKFKFEKPEIISLKASTATIYIAAAMLGTAPASVAANIEKAALFDFNLTLPIIMGEFLVLMVALDKVYYTPLGNFMDRRDAEIKEKLSSVKDTSAEVQKMEEEGKAVMKAARAEIAAALNKMKKETAGEVEKKMGEGRKKVEAELVEALALLEKHKEDTVLALDSQISALSDYIVKKVLPIS
ncbi:hypothetical protein HHK36_006277 [Tetracentron sinense]|uniref:ATP synthase subunit b', chloroplastic n=1 Tax=Tetracentron sinense TaxID=13715 RepID=A0A834ZP83_TETSI|nr:hypothetical protein HHK36_006277 [Tetracentron sinense]